MRLLKSVSLLCFFLFGLIIVGHTQEGDYTNDAEKRRILSPAKFNQILLNKHPVARKAELIAESGEYEVKKARGNFDPKLFSDWDSKTFNDKHYYQVNESGIKIPTWLGLDFKLYHQSNSGIFLNPENKDPSSGLYGIGVSVPVGEGLFTDERRTALNKAKVFRQMNRNRREQLLVNLLNRGFKDYWEWAGYFQKRAILDTTVKRAEERFENVKGSYLGGEKQAIDTTDALSQLRRWQVKLAQMEGKYAKQKQLLATYLWDEDQQPVALQEGTKPPDLLALDLSTVESLLEQARDLDSIPDNHPMVRKYQNKLEVLSIQNRWKKEQIKPELDLRYNALQNAPNPELPDGDQLTTNMKWGLSFEFPIFLRKELNSLRLNQVKRKTTRLEFQNKQQQMMAKLNGLQDVLANLYEQIQRNQQNLSNYERLVEAEQIKFNTGESNLFRINYREMRYLKAQMDQVTYLVDFFKTYSEIMYQYQLYKEDVEAFNNDQ